MTTYKPCLSLLQEINYLFRRYFQSYIINRLYKNEVKYVKMLTKISTLHTVQTSVSRSNEGMINVTLQSLRSNEGMINVTLQSLRITTGFRMAFQQHHSLKGKNLIGHQKIFIIPL